MEVEWLSPSNCNCSNGIHNTVLIIDRQGVSADRVAKFAEENNATCKGDICIRFAGCAVDVVSFEGLEEALST